MSMIILDIDTIKESSRDIFLHFLVALYGLYEVFFEEIWCKFNDFSIRNQIQVNFKGALKIFDVIRIEIWESRTKA